MQTAFPKDTMTIQEHFDFFWDNRPKEVELPDYIKTLMRGAFQAGFASAFYQIELIAHLPPETAVVWWEAAAKELSDISAKYRERANAKTHEDDPGQDGNPGNPVGQTGLDLDVQDVPGNPGQVQ
jgi:hypothetical protein